MEKQIKTSTIKPNPENPRVIRDAKFKKLVNSIKEFPQMMALRPMVVDENNMLLGGNMRLRAIQELGMKEIPENWVKKASDLTEEQKKEFIIKDNTGFGEWDWDMIANEWDVQQVEEWGLDIPVFDNGDDELGDQESTKKLSDRFIIPPFSVLDTKQGCWQERKNWWLSLGIESELGRSAKAYTANDAILSDGSTSFYNSEYSGTSIFDPVLCELAYQWFNVPNGKILDPFAGGSVRGIVAAKLGFEYLGNDLRKEQVEANRANANDVLKDSQILPTWTTGDSINIDKLAKGYTADMIFSCPPYADLEVYSDMKEDISNMPYADFLRAYREIIKKSCEKLKEDRFAVFVVGDVRDKTGLMRDIISDTIKAHLDNGLHIYNSLILVNMLGNLPMRVARYFNSSRKIGRQHQHVLVFYKGDPKKIKANYKELDLSYIDELSHIE